MASCYLFLTRPRRLHLRFLSPWYLLCLPHSGSPLSSRSPSSSLSSWHSFTVLSLPHPRYPSFLPPFQLLIPVTPTFVLSSSLLLHRHLPLLHSPLPFSLRFSPLPVSALPPFPRTNRVCLSLQAGSRWIELVFNKRECIKFIPSSKDNARWVLRLLRLPEWLWGRLRWKALWFAWVLVCV